MSKAKSEKSKKSDRPNAVLTKAVKDKYFGENVTGECFSCLKELHYTDAIMGHVEAKSKGGKTDIDNLRPICSKCNGSMGVKNMNEFIKTLEESGVRKHNMSKKELKKESESKKDNAVDMNFLNVKDLKYICYVYGISESGTKKDLIKRIAEINNFDYDKFIADELKDFTVAGLKSICDDLGLVKTGKKSDLIDRINTMMFHITDYIGDEPEDESEDDVPVQQPVQLAYNPYRDPLVEDILKRQQQENERIAKANREQAHFFDKLLGLK